MTSSNPNFDLRVPPRTANPALGCSFRVGTHLTVVYQATMDFSAFLKLATGQKANGEDPSVGAVGFLNPMPRPRPGLWPGSRCHACGDAGL